jgi:hypothetical protein
MQSSMQAHMVMAREMPRLSQMKGVLAPFPLPGAPFSHTTSSGAWIGCDAQSSSTASGVLVWMPVVLKCAFQPYNQAAVSLVVSCRAAARHTPSDCTLVRRCIMFASVVWTAPKVQIVWREAGRWRRHLAGGLQAVLQLAPAGVEHHLRLDADLVRAAHVEAARPAGVLRDSLLPR